MAQYLFTFGYEGLDLDRFTRRLIESGVSTIVDVRAVPLSRKKGFSKNALAAALRLAGLEYVHIPAMGCPKPIRDRYREDRDWNLYTRSFLSYLDSQGEALQNIVKLAQISPCCLLCFEADFNRCHRIYIGRAAANRGGFQLAHITDRKMIPERPLPFAA
jgi:uncharacterized protein (DUF488 family)